VAEVYWRESPKTLSATITAINIGECAMSNQSKFVKDFARACEKVAKWYPEYQVVFPGRKAFLGVTLIKQNIQGVGFDSQIGEEPLAYIRITPDDLGEIQITCSQDDLDTVFRDLGFECQPEKCITVADGKIKVNTSWRITYWSMKRGDDWVQTVECSAPQKVVAMMMGLIDLVDFLSKGRVVAQLKKWIPIGRN
jgi:hypothetical protein